MINGQIPKWEENPTATTQPLLQSKECVLMGPCRWGVPHIRALWDSRRGR